VTDGRADRIDPIAPVPPYRQIAEILRRRITSGQYRPDTRMPTESELVEEFEVARTTARRAVGVLRDEGLIYTVPTRGSYVSPQPSKDR
jgi:GntR family transcriptional regulator